MPIYLYRCSECGAELEDRAKMSDPPLTTCSACGEETLARRIGRTAFKLKGGGWYAQGYNKGSSGGSAEAS